MVLALDKLRARHIPCPATVLCTMHSPLTKQDISRWRISRTDLFEAQGLGYGNRRTVQKWSRVQFPEANDELYLRFLYRRDYHGFEAGDSWLQDEMENVLEDLKPPGWEDAKCSPGLITGKSATRVHARSDNKKHSPIVECLPAMRTFHRWLLHTLQRSAPQLVRVMDDLAPVVYSI
jgi:hypothetical protein